MKKLLAAVAIVLAQAGIAPAATMGFDNLSTFASDFSGKKYYEHGIAAAANAPLFESYFRSPDMLYLADSGWGGSSLVTFTMASAFNAISFDLKPSVFDYVIRNTMTGAVKPATYANVRVSGFNDAGLAAELIFDMGTVLTSKTFFLGTAFTNLTSLVIGFSNPVLGKVGKNQVAECSAPCSRFRIDNINLAPVPLPASLGLMIAALAGMGFVARRRRAAVNV